MQELERQYHIACTGEDVGRYCILPGDPGRVPAIAALFDDARQVACNREYNVWTGTLLGQKVTACSTGIGGPSAAIAMEELHKCGADTFIRTGTCGGMQPDVTAGSLIIATGACREEGVTEKMIPLSYPAIADGEVVAALTASARALDIPVHKGIVLTQALFYPGFLESTVKLYAKAGVKAMENEVASLLVVASLHGVKAGAIIAADAPAFELVGVDGYNQTADDDAVAQAVENEISIALDAIVQVPLD